MTGVLLTGLRCVLGGVFLYAAATKLGNMTVFAEQVANFRLLPAAGVPLLAAVLPGIEVVTGALLVVGVAARGAAALAAGMLAVFIVGLSQALARGINLECGCFGGADVATWGTVWRDVALLVPALLVLACGPGRFAAGEEASRTAPLRNRR